VATISRLLKIIGLFCKTALQKRRYSAKETYNFKEPTNRSHLIPHFQLSPSCILMSSHFRIVSTNILIRSTITTNMVIRLIHIPHCQLLSSCILMSSHFRIVSNNISYTYSIVLSVLWIPLGPDVVLITSHICIVSTSM